MATDTRIEHIRALCAQHAQYEAGSAYTRTKILCDVLTKLGMPIPSWMVLREHIGKVVLEFQMTADGKVVNMRVAECDASVGDLLAIVCQRAVLDPVPYAPWPPEMKRKIGVNYREVRFTFYYE